MRIGHILGALLEVERLAAALADVVSRGWPCSVDELPRERALHLGRVDLAGAPCASVGDSAALILVEATAGSHRPGGWLELQTTLSGAPVGVCLACENPMQALGWYRGLGLAGSTRPEIDGAISVDLSQGQWLRFVLRASVQAAPSWRPLAISFARVDAQGRQSPGLRPRLLAGPECETIELL